VKSLPDGRQQPVGGKLSEGSSVRAHLVKDRRFPVPAHREDFEARVFLEQGIEVVATRLIRTDEYDVGVSQHDRASETNSLIGSHRNQIRLVPQRLRENVDKK
jgi:hypothetical protein